MTSVWGFTTVSVLVQQALLSHQGMKDFVAWRDVKEVLLLRSG